MSVISFELKKIRHLEDKLFLKEFFFLIIFLNIIKFI
jgi:hypothetical protein